MACSRGKATPDQNTQRRLFAASAGHCQNPGCLRQLFIDTGSKTIHVAELAHVFAAMDDGPRANETLTEAERGLFENIILLCSSCHTMVDKAEEDFPAEVLTQWKADHARKIAKVFGAAHYASRVEVRAAIEPLFAENGAIHGALNPDLDYKTNPEAEEALKWQRAMRDRIIPNNRRILAILDENRDHLVAGETDLVEAFRLHVYDQEIRHLTDVAPGAQARYPAGMTAIMANN